MTRRKPATLSVYSSIVQKLATLAENFAELLALVQHYKGEFYCILENVYIESGSAYKLAESAVELAHNARKALYLANDTALNVRHSWRDLRAVLIDEIDDEDVNKVQVEICIHTEEVFCKEIADALYNETVIMTIFASYGIAGSRIKPYDTSMWH